MEQKIIDRAKWLYAYNGGARTKEDCARQAVNEQDTVKLAVELGIFDATIDDYIKYVVKQF